MEEPLPLDGADEDAAIPAHVTKDAKGEDEKNLEARFYRYGVRSEWLQIYRILNHRYITTNSQFSVFTKAVVCLLYMQMDDIVISYGKVSVTKCPLSAKDQAYILASFTIMHSTVHVAKVAHSFS